ncbi:MAG: hypothetical protein MHM6MM_001030 [Cercozoa sp. M6MM]
MQRREASLRCACLLTVSALHGRKIPTRVFEAMEQTLPCTDQDSTNADSDGSNRLGAHAIIATYEFENNAWWRKLVLGACWTICALSLLSTSHVSYLWLLLTEILCVIILSIDLVVIRLTRERTTLCRWLWLLALVACICDIASDTRVSLPLRAVFLAVRATGVRSMLSQAIRSIPRVAPAVCALFCVLAAFGLVGYSLFTQASEDFGSVSRAMTTLLHFLAGATNSPDAALPLVRKSAASYLFFVAFACVALFLLSNVVLALSYRSYKTEAQACVRLQLSCAKRNLQLAFRFLSQLDESSNVSRVTFRDFFWGFCGHTDTCLADAVFDAMTDSESSLSEETFTRHAMDYLNNTFVDLRPIGCRNNHSDVSVRLRIWQWANRHQTLLEALTDAVLCANGVVLVAQASHVMTINPAVNTAFLVIFVAELSLKLSFVGRRFFVNPWNKLDLLLVFGSAAGTLFFSARHNFSALRVFRLARLARRVPHFRRVWVALTHILPALRQLLALLFCMVYTGASVFHLLLRDTRRTIPPAVPAGVNSMCNSNDFWTTYTTQHYAEVHFDTMTRSLMTSFSLLLVNQWHVISESYVCFTQSTLIRLPFLLFWVIAVLLLSNTFASFLIDVFGAALDAQRHKRHVITGLPMHWRVVPYSHIFQLRRLCEHVPEERFDSFVILNNRDDGSICKLPSDSSLRLSLYDCHRNKVEVPTLRIRTSTSSTEMAQRPCD